jgi:hypothetical protein
MEIFQDMQYIPFEVEEPVMIVEGFQTLEGRDQIL